MKIFYVSAPDGKNFAEEVLKQFYGVNASDICVNEHGKPYLPGGNLFFNLSHSGNLTALAVGKREMGLDAETRKRRDLNAIFRRMTPAERNEDFFRLWTAKEAYVKFKGSSLAKLLPRLEYRGGVLYEDGAPVSATLLFAELKECVLCLCTAAPETTEWIPL